MSTENRISPDLLNPDNHVLFIIDQESQMAFGNHTHNPTKLTNNN